MKTGIRHTERLKHFFAKKNIKGPAVDHFDEVADNIRCHAVLPARAGFEQQGFIGEAANDLGEVSFASRSIHAVSDVKLSQRMFGERR